METKELIDRLERDHILKYIEYTANHYEPYNTGHGISV